MPQNNREQSHIVFFTTASPDTKSRLSTGGALPKATDGSVFRSTRPVEFGLSPVPQEAPGF
jgi:hypothetical protein